MVAKRKKVYVNNEEDHVPTEVLAKSIVDIARAVRAIINGPLDMRAVVLLIHDACGVNKRDIEAVLEAAADLEERYVKKSKRKGDDDED